ncbi:hypothetical protein N7490_011012 [Penicillium lividum]|nr:hypothetical protein N7490_011012 [Penicillium lividum]
MCITWTRKYTLCGCILVEEDILCEEDQICFGRRMVIIYSHLQTCKECWKSGDKRVNETVAKAFISAETEKQQESKGHSYQDNEVHDETPSCNSERENTHDLTSSVIGESRETSKEESSHKKEAPEISMKCTCKTVPIHSSQFYNGDEEGQVPDMEDCTEDEIRLTNPSRPQTPIIDYDLDPDNLPWYLLHYEYYCDTSRTCDPVKLSSMWRDYRTTREKSNWVYLENETSNGEYEYDDGYSEDREDRSPWWWWKRDSDY